MRGRTCGFLVLVIYLAAAVGLPVRAMTTAPGTPAPATTVLDSSLLDLAERIERDRWAGDSSDSYRTSIPVSEYGSFSAIGAIVCSVDGAQRTATAFLVGRFDLAVTVAHAFEFQNGMAQPQECEYLVSGPLGQIRERIPLARIHSQWRSDIEAFGRPDRDLAVVHLSSAARVPQRTLSLAKFAFTGAPVSLIGFSPELATNPQQRRLRGHVYLRPRNSCVRFAHDIPSRIVSSGAPIIDRRDGVVIGVHNYLRTPTAKSSDSCSDRGNAMLLMNDWLENTLRGEIAGRLTLDRR